MGVWGTGIFSGDTAADIRGDYRELLEDQVPDEEAASRVIDRYRDLDADEEHVRWLALAAAQSRLGRLDATVRARALDVIDNDRELHLWGEAGARAVAQRKAALIKLRDQLTGPQPVRKAVRRPWRHETDLQPGDVLSFRGSREHLAILRVLRVDDHRVGAAPVLALLDWRSPKAPDDQQLRLLETRLEPPAWAGGPKLAQHYRVALGRKKDPDWRDAGFVLAARVPPRPAPPRGQERAGSKPSELDCPRPHVGRPADHLVARY